MILRHRRDSAAHERLCDAVLLHYGFILIGRAWFEVWGALPVDDGVWDWRLELVPAWQLGLA